ncbi:MAG TPA: acetyl-CoA carboxylase biotin carboxyl carrier protein [Nitrospirota bacterium]
MNLKEVRELIDILKDTDVSEFELEKAGSKVRIKKGAVAAVHHAVLPAPVQPLAPAQGAPAGAQAAEAMEESAKKNIVVVTSPIVGTFYRSPSPEAPIYVEVGDVVKKGQILCIIEAMKLMNEIEAEVSGRVVAAMVENAQPVEYGEALFQIEPMQ